MSSWIINNCKQKFFSIINFGLVNIIDDAYKKYEKKIYTLQDFTNETGIFLRDSKKINYISTSKFNKFSKYIEYFRSTFEEKSGSLSEHDIKALKVLISNLIYSAQLDFIPLNYSRSTNWFNGMSGKTVWLKFRSYIKIIKLLNNEGYFYNFNWNYDKIKKNGSQSRMIPSKKFITTLLNIDTIASEQLIDMNDDKSNISILQFKTHKKKKNKRNQQEEITHDMIENNITSNNDGHILNNIKMTTELRRMKSKIEKINTALKKHVIELRLSEEQLKDMRKRCSVNIDLNNIWYRRIFNNCSEGSNGHDLIRFGGRLYDESCNIPSDYRDFITINGKRTVELDFSNTHPALIYASKFNSMPEGDLYQIAPEIHDDFFKQINVKLRPILKTILTAAINVDKERYNQYIFNIIYGKIYSELHKISPEKFTFYINDEDKKKYRTLSNKKCGIPSKVEGEKNIIEIALEKFEEKHKQIFDIQSEILGAECFKMESDIALNILTEFILKRKIAVLQIYDSFVIEEKYEKELCDVMVKEFQNITKTNIVPKIHRK